MGAVEKKVNRDVFETKTLYELVREITNRELTKDKKACANSYGCTFVPEKTAVTAKAYKFNCGVRQKTECAKDGDKKTPTDKEKTEEKKTARVKRTQRKSAKTSPQTARAPKWRDKTRKIKLKPVVFELHARHSANLQRLVV